MAKYDVLAGNDGLFYLDVQASRFHDLNTHVVIPLMPIAIAPAPAPRLNPELFVDGQVLLMVTQYMSATPKASLGSVVTSLGDQQDRINTAIDVLLYGF